MNGKKSRGIFDDEGRKNYSTHSPCYVGTRKAGPRPANPPRWQASLMSSWARVEQRDARKRARADGRPFASTLLPEPLAAAFAEARRRAA